MSTPRLRFAPSPTGYFHVGSARSALFNWFVARQSGGTFLLRIEDTDETRNREEWVDGIRSAMAWLGLDVDGPIARQSDNDAAHRAATALLHAQGYLYYCDCTGDAVAARKGENKTPGYDGFCRDRGLAAGPTTALRFAMPREGTTVVPDLIRGDVVFENTTIDDFVVAKSSGAVLYALANVVDDRNDQITHVVRGEEHLPNAPKQMLLWRALNAATGHDVALPVYAHLPLLVNEQRKKLSKRKDPVATELYRDQGYLASAFVNYLALMGWSPRGEEEIVPLEVMIREFRLEDVNHSPAFFDVKKLTHMNGEYIRALSPEAFVEACGPWVSPREDAWRPSGYETPWAPADFDAELFARVAPLIQTRVSTLGDVAPMVAFFFGEVTLDEAAADKAIRNELGRAVLAAMRERLVDAEWRTDVLHEHLLAVAEELSTNLRKAQAPVRCAVTGTLVGPPLFESMELLGRARTLSRLEAALS